MKDPNLAKFTQGKTDNLNSSIFIKEVEFVYKTPQKKSLDPDDFIDEFKLNFEGETSTNFTKTPLEDERREHFANNFMRSAVS